MGRLSSSARRRRNGAGLSWCLRMSLGVCAAVLSWPVPAAAQKEVFFEGLLELTEAATGTYGDEGARLEAAIQKMADGLDGWDRSIRAVEARVRSARRAVGLEGAAETRVALARRYLERGRPADALRALEAAAWLEPRRAELHVLRGVALQASGRAADAVRAFRTAWELEPENPVHAYYVMATASAGEDLQPVLESLSSAYDRLIRGDSSGLAPPVFQPGLLDLGSTAPIVPTGAYARAYALLAGGEYGSGLAELRRAVRDDPLVTDPATRLDAMTLGTTALRQGRLAEALRHLDDVRAAAPASSEVRRVLGLVYLAASQYDESLAHLDAAILANPLDERSRLTRARVLADAGRAEEAERTLRAALARFPGSPLAHWWLARTYESINEVSEARRHLEFTAAGVLTGGAALYGSIGRLARIDGDFAGAVKAFARAASRDPNSARAHKNLGLTYLDEGRVTEALRELVAACLIEPADAEAHVAIGRIHLDAGRHDAAVRALGRAVELVPGHHEARYALATALTRLGDTDAAAREFDAFERSSRQALAARRRDMALDVLIEEATFHAGEGRYDRSAAFWRQVVERDPRQPSHRVNLGSALTRAGRLHEAIEQYETAAALEGGPEVYRRLAELYARVGRAADGERARTMSDRLRQAAPSGRDVPR